MNINATEQLLRTLDEIEAKIKHLENSPNRAFVLVEYDTLNLFHWFNECFKQFWDEFDHSSSKLLLFRYITKKHSELIDKYETLFREQIDYLESVIDFKDHSVKELPPVIFAEDNRRDVIGYYMERFKDEKDENEKPLYYIELDSDTNFEIINGKEVPIDFYMFRSDELNNKHYTGLVGMYYCLNSLSPLVYTVCSYPNVLQLGYTPSEEEIICQLNHEMRRYAQQIGKNVYRELRKLSLELNRTSNESRPFDVWGKVMEVEDDAFRLAICDKLEGNEEKRFEYIDEDQRKLWTENYSLLQKIKDTCIDDELFDIRLSVDTHNLLSSLNADNLDLFYELVLRRNIIHREMFPEKLGTEYEEWLNPIDNKETLNQNKSQEGINYYAPQINLQEMLKQECFNEVRKDPKYDEKWTDTFIEDLMKSEYGKTIAEDWALNGIRNKRNQIKGHVFGVLKDAGVLEGGYDTIAAKVVGKDEARTFGKYMGDGKNQPYAEWVKDYVTGVKE